MTLAQTMQRSADPRQPWLLSLGYSYYMRRSVAVIARHRRVAVGTTLLILALLGLLLANRSRVATRTTSSSIQLPITLGPAESGQSVRLHIHQQVIVRLDSLSWNFATVSGIAVQQLKPQWQTRQTHGCLSNLGCGTTELAVTAVRHGRSVIRAVRGVCGEDYICPPDQRSFSVLLIVD
jgi:hypothetical protein